MSSIKYLNRPGHPVPFNMNVDGAPGTNGVMSDDYGKTNKATGDQGPRPQGTRDRGTRTDVSHSGAGAEAETFKSTDAVPNRSAWPRHRAVSG